MSIVLQDKTCVALCANRAILPGLFGTILSLVKSCSSPEHLKIYLFSDNLTEEDIQPIRAVMDHYCDKECLQLRIADSSPFHHFRSLQGDWMTYFRLMLPRLLAEYDFVLYLDSDLILELDINEIFDHAPSDAPFAAAGIGQIENSLESTFFQSVGLKPDDRSLNAGILVFNTEVCETVRFFERCMAFAEKHRNHLQSADQTVLTAVFSKEFKVLPIRFNQRLTASMSCPEKGETAIFHFVGSPKPWDIGGRLVHRSFRIWKDATRSSAYSHSMWIIKNWRIVARRTWTIRRSYLREFLKRLKGY